MKIVNTCSYDVWSVLGWSGSRVSGSKLSISLVLNHRHAVKVTDIENWLRISLKIYDLRLSFVDWSRKKFILILRLNLWRRSYTWPFNQVLALNTFYSVNLEISSVNSPNKLLTLRAKCEISNSVSVFN